MEAIIPADLATYLGAEFDTDDTARATMLIGDAVAQALSIVTVGTVPDTGPTVANLPAGAEGVLRAAISRAFVNPMGITQEVAGSFSYSRSATSGSMFSNAEKAMLKNLAGRSGAFSVDLLAASGFPSLADS